MSTSRISGFHHLSLEERLDNIAKRCNFSEEELLILKQGGLSLYVADHLVENVIGLSALPFSVATNFRMNDRDYLIPMCIEEPSVVAAASRAALLVREGGGFSAQADPSIMIGQVHLMEVKDTQSACKHILWEERQILAMGNQALISLVHRGGGMRGLEVRVLSPSTLEQTGELVVHLLLDCQDAMGANLTNTLSEALAPYLASLAQAQAGLRILSNLADQRCVRIRCEIPIEALQSPPFSGEELRDRIIKASQFAEKDPYRAATHNKGIMNGVDAVTLATGNDWRAVEAGAHAFAARQGTYRPLSTWTIGSLGQLQGQLEMPLPLGIRGGTLTVRPSVQVALKILQVSTAGELSKVAGCVGLATNLAALRALAGHGIQTAHMPLHHRSSELRTASMIIQTHQS